MSTEKSELAKMKVTELRKLAEQLGVETPSKKIKAELIKSIMAKQKKRVAKPTPKPKPEAKAPPPVEKIFGIFVNFRQGMFRQYPRNILIRIPGIDSSNSAAKYIGRKVIWRSKSGKKLVGKIVKTHGRNGVLRSRFKKGLPGQAIGSSVEII
ncbi:MAG: 50S ribosomal protein L35ae [Candidatus Bathyarchaeia archaeon]